MNIIVHFPTDEHSIKSLQQNVAKVHTGAVASHIDNLTCPKAQKIALLDALIDTVKNKEDISMTSLSPTIKTNIDKCLQTI